MTCDDCQAIGIDIARGCDVERTLREDARRHAAFCPRCGEHQQEQQWLTEQFRAIASADAALQAPERVEIAALAAWRAEYGSRAEPLAKPRAEPLAKHRSGAAGATTATVVSMSVASRSGAARHWMLPGAALAGLAVAAMGILFVWPASQGRADSASTATPTGAPTAAGTVSTRSNTVGTSAGGTSPAGTSAGGIRAGGTSAAGTTAAAVRNSQGKDDGVLAVAGDSAGEHVGAPMPIVAAGSSRALRPRVESVLARATTDDGDFVSLPYVEPLRATEARQVVRVSMSSGDEMIIGVLPVDRRNGQPFEADVLVGEDGIARAIRIVR